MLLIGDIGGTKTNLALFEKKRPLKIIREEKYPSASFEGLSIILDQFLSKGEKIEGACFGVAGPVRDGKVNATNLPWVIDAIELKKQLGIEVVYLLNDLEANAYGICTLSEKEFVTLNKGIEQKGNQGLISAGTGLGQAGLFFDGKMHTPFACEGGHTDFAPREEKEIELLRFAQKKFGHVSYERILSGPGFPLIYEFLEKKPLVVSEEDPAKVICDLALEQKDPTCLETVEMFVSIYGAEAGNVALKFLSLSGIYIGGGIAPKILDLLKSGPFMESFLDKGRFKDLLSTIPVKVIMNDKTALLGACEYAIRKL